MLVVFVSFIFLHFRGHPAGPMGDISRPPTKRMFGVNNHVQVESYCVSFGFFWLVPDPMSGRRCVVLNYPNEKFPGVAKKGRSKSEKRGHNDNNNGKDCVVEITNHDESSRYRSE